MLACSVDGLLVTIDTEEDFGVAQIRRSLDVDYREHRRMQRFVFDLSRQEIGKLLAQEMIDALDATRWHGPITLEALIRSAGRVLRRSRKKESSLEREAELAGSSGAHWRGNLHYKEKQNGITRV